jgi:hypothetical protein
MEPAFIEIRPLRITEIVAAALKSLVKNPAATIGLSFNFAIFLGLAALAALLILPPDQQFMARVNELAAGEQINNEQVELLVSELVPAVITVLVLTLLFYVIQILLVGVLSPVIGFLVTGTKLSANEAWMRVKPQVSKLLALAVVIILIQITLLVAPTIIVVLISSILPDSFASILLSISLFAGLILLIVSWTSLLLAPSVLVFENSTIRNALVRSRQLVKKNFARIFFGAFWASLIAQALALIIQIPFSLIKSDNPAEISTLSVFLDTIGTIIGYSVLLPFFASFIILLYTDQRIRHENLSQNLKSALGQ